MDNKLHSKNAAQFKRRRLVSHLLWVYTLLLLLATVTLGTFVVAFVASIKDDALHEPNNINIPQLHPSNWFSAATLGHSGGASYLFGGFKPEGNITFRVTYATTNDNILTEPVIEIPRRKPGSGMASIAYPHFAADYANVSSIKLITTDENVDYVQTLGIKKLVRKGKSATWEFTIQYSDYGPDIKHIPLDITTPRHQVLIDSTIPPNRFERRGRVASWSNISPGLVGYIFKSYARVWNESVSLDTGESLFWSWTVNSFFIAVMKMILTVLIACAGGFALARMQFAGSRVIFVALVVSMAVPMQVSFISNYEVFNSLGLLNTPWAVVGLLVASAQVLIMKQFFESFPRELEEAAVVDGASPPAILWHVFMPLAKPAIASVAILAFQGTWNDFFWPLVVLTTPPEAYTLPVGLLSLRNSYGVAGDWNLILAGSFLSTVPVLIIFIVFQRYFVGNNVNSAVKG